MEAATEMVDLEKGGSPTVGGDGGDDTFFDVNSMPLPELPVLVQLKNVSYDLVTEIPGKSFFAPKQQIKKSVFRDVSFQVTPGELLAIMGPTGCGKTSLLNVIGGRNNKGISGDILFNNAPRTKELKRITGYVLQDDLLFGSLTVQQTLDFTASLRLPLSKAEKNRRVEEILEALNLKKCRNTIIGNQWIRGVSGGERKRCNIGNELITNPSLILLDEPTSGLDSFTSEALLSTLQAIARQGRTIVTTIHQPSSQIFAMFDKILLMCEGNIVYYGPAKEVVSYFSRLGHQCPVNYNPADFMLGLLVSEEMKGTVPLKAQLIEAYKAHYEQSKKDKFHFLNREEERRSTLLDIIKEADEQRKSRKASSAAITPPSKGPTPIRDVEKDENTASGLNLSNVQTYRTDGKTKWWQKQGKYPTSWFQQTWILFQRCMLLQRDKMFDKNPLLNVLIVSTLVGLLFLRLENKESAIQDRISVSFFLGVFAGGFVPLIAGVFSIPAEETVIRKERNAGAFGLSAYYVAKNIADTPLQLIYSALFIVISYWMVGLNSDPRAFFSYLGICLLATFTCYSLGLAIGSVFPRDLPFASLMATISVLAMMLVGGFYIPLAHLPWWIKWMQYISVIRYLYMSLLSVDLRGEFFTQEKVMSVFDQYGNPITGEDILRGPLDLEPDLVWAWCLVMIGYAILFRILGYLALRFLNRPQT